MNILKRFLGNVAIINVEKDIIYLRYKIANLYF
jgi:hypothetical protein